MTTRFVRLAVTTLVVVAAPAAAQRPAVARLTPYVGYMSFGNYADGPIGTRIRNESAALFGVQLGIDLTDKVAFVGNVGYSDSNVEVGIPIIGGLNIADSKIVMYDAGLQLKLPVGDALGVGLSPFVEAGAGAMRTEVRAAGLKTQSTNFAGNYGVGADIRLNRSIGIRAMAKDYVGKFDMQEATRINLNTKVTHNWAYSVGINLGF